MSVRQIPSTLNLKPTDSALPLWHQLRWILILSFVVLAVLPVVLVIVITLYRTDAQARQQVTNQLQSVAELKRNEISHWLKDTQFTLRLLTSDPGREERFKSLLTRAANQPSTNDGSTDNEGQLADLAQEQEAVSRILRYTVEAESFFEETFLYDAEGRVVAASKEIQIGKIVTTQPYFARSLAQQVIQTPYYEVGTGELAMFITYPLVDENRQTLGVLAGRLDLGRLSEIMGEREGLGEFGETYLVSLENNYLLTPSRYEGYPLTRAYHSQGIDQVLQGIDGEGIYLDYRDPPVSVVGAYRWIPEMQVGLVAEADEQEVLAPFRETRNFSLAITVLAAVAAAGVGFFTATRISGPITELTQVAIRMTGGELDQRVTVRQHNEVGLLSSAFNSMATQLQEIINTLEERVADRTRALETSMEVSRNLSTILDKKQLVSEVVEQVRSAFNYYYAHIYLLDDTGQNLIMVGGTGQAGEKMLAKGHKIPLGKGLVGQTAETGKIILVPDVFKEDGWLPNPLLPETKSEVSVPIVVGNQILGVLDVQNNLVAGLTQDDCDLLQSIANQVAIGLQNADLYARQERLTTIIEATTDLVAITDPTGRMLYLNRAGRRIIGLHKDEEISRKHLEHYYAEATKATVANQITATATRNGVWTGETTMVSRDGRQIPMSQVVIAHKRNGSVEFFSSIARDITERKQAEEALTRALSETQVLYDVSQALTATTSLRGILENMLLALNQNGIALRANSVSLVSIEVDETGRPDWGELLAIWHPKPGDLTTPVGTRYLFKELALTQIWTQDPFNPIMVSDPRTDERIDEVTRTLLEGQALGTVILPLSIAGRWVGLLTISWQDPQTFQKQETRIYRTLMRQLATAVESQRLFEQAQHRAAQFEKLSEIEVELSKASNEAEIVEVMAGSLIPDDSFQIALSYIDLDETNQPIANRITTAWQHGSFDPDFPYLNHSFKLEDYPISKLWRDNPDKALFISDIQTDPRADENILELSTEVNFRSLTILPLYSGGTWQGVLTLAGPEPYEFSSGDRFILEWLLEPLSALIASRRATLALADALTVQKRLSSELTTVAEVATATSTILEPNKLLQAVVDLTKEQFNLYHAHIYLLDETKDKLILAAGSGEVGRQMVAQGWSIPLKEKYSIVVRAARTRQGVRVNNVYDDPNFLPNDLLPDTLAELALPMIVGNKVLGVLDVQADVAGRFTDDDIQLKSTLASQVAVALENAQSFVEEQRALELVNKRQQELSCLNEVGREIVKTPPIPQLLQWVTERVPPALQYPELCIAAIEYDNEIYGTPEAIKLPYQIVHALRVSGEIVGRVYIAYSQKREFLDEESSLIGGIASRLSGYLENRRLFELTRQSRDRLSFALEAARMGSWDWDLVTNEVTWSDEVENVFGIEPGTFDGAYETYRQLIHPDDLPVLDQTVGRALEDPDYDYFIEHRTILDNEVIRWLEGRGQVMRDETGQPIRMVGTIMDISERKQAEETLAKRAAELAAVAEVSTATSTILEAKKLLQAVVDLTKDRFDLYHAHIYLLNEAGDTLDLAAGAGDVGRTMVAQDWSIPFNQEHSLVAQAARERKGIIVNNVREDPEFLPNPLLSDTKAEMAVPMIIGEKLWGVLDIQSDREDYFSQEDIRIQTTLAAQVAVALENANQYQQAESRAQQEQILREITARVRSSNNLDTIIRTAVRQLGTVLDRRTFVRLGTTEQLSQAGPQQKVRSQTSELKLNQPDPNGQGRDGDK